MSTTALDCPAQRFLPWAGANTANAHRVGELLAGCKYVAVPFVGGFTEVPHITARIIVVNDKHEDVINLGRCVANPESRRRILRALRFLPVCSEVRDWACDLVETHPGYTDREERALAYFVSQWMGRSGQSGTPSELSGNVPVRTNANGGGTAQRYWTAVRSLAEWGAVMRRCDFESLDWRMFGAKYMGDFGGHGYYLDPPSWPGAKVQYTHGFTEEDHRDLADTLNSYRHARIVVRYGDHPLIRELYPESEWTWHLMDGRNQGNNAVREALIVRN